MIVPQIVPLLEKIISSGLYVRIYLPCLGIGLVVAISHLIRHIISGRD